MDDQKLQGSWFSEISPDVCPGQSFALEVRNVLEKKKSKYQEILVFESSTYGRVLVLDGMIQVTERDEFAYQEMMTHVPMFCHPNPSSVLIVGGGDGGILREVLKHPSVKTVVQCEIDQDVIDVSKKYLPSLSRGFNDPRLQLHIGDGMEFLKHHADEFDVIITDSSDPVGPGESLFESSYFDLLKQALRKDGLLASQGESIWLHLDLIKSLIATCQEKFPVVDYASAAVPSYPSGQIGVILCSKNPRISFRTPLRRLSTDEIVSQEWNLRYYDSSVHSAAFVLPRFASEALKTHS